jgi:hypothetical protein
MAGATTRRNLLKRDLLLVDHLAHVDQCVTHPTEGRVDGNARQLGNFLEAHIGIVAEDDHFPLLGWQGVHQLAHFVVGLTANHSLLGVPLGTLQDVEDVEGFRLANLGAALVAAEGVNAHIVADAHRPLQEFALVVVLATAQGVNDFDEDFLEDVFGLAVVLGEEVNGGIDFLLVAAEEFLECLILTFQIEIDQLLIIQRLDVHD